jgi:zinc transporter 1/2/3
MAGFIAMVSMMVVVGVEMFFATKGAGHSHSSEYSSVSQATREQSGHAGRQNGHARPPNRRTESLRPFKQAPLGAHGESSENLVSRQNHNWSEEANGHEIPLVSKTKKSTEDDDNESDLDLEELDPQSHELPYIDTLADDPEAHSAPRPGAGPTSPLTEHQAQQKALLQCLLLEAGILFHSIFIGMAVSVATGTAFIVLLIAISFHQTFEGLALGSRIAAISAFEKGSWKPWLMALAYGTTTPAGQAIGLLVHNLYDPYSQMGLLMVGVMNAISSGLLLFAGLVELLAEDFLSDHSYETLKGARRLEACAAVVAGSMLMALVGAWA